MLNFLKLDITNAHDFHISKNNYLTNAIQHALWHLNWFFEPFENHQHWMLDQYIASNRIDGIKRLSKTEKIALIHKHLLKVNKPQFEEKFKLMFEDVNIPSEIVSIIHNYVGCQHELLDIRVKRIKNAVHMAPKMNEWCGSLYSWFQQDYYPEHFRAWLRWRKRIGDLSWLEQLWMMELARNTILSMYPGFIGVNKDLRRAWLRCMCVTPAKSDTLQSWGEVLTELRTYDDNIFNDTQKKYTKFHGGAELRMQQLRARKLLSLEKNEQSI